MILSTRNIEVSHDLEYLEQLTFENNKNTSIKNIDKDNNLFDYNGEYINFSYLPPNSTIFVYSLTGYLLMHKDHLEGNYTLPLSNFKNGIYLIKINNTPYKIIKK